MSEFDTPLQVTLLHTQPRTTQHHTTQKIQHAHKACGHTDFTTTGVNVNALVERDCETKHKL